MTAANATLPESLVWVLGPLGTVSAEPPFWRLAMEEGEELPRPPGATLLFAGSIPDLGNCAFYEVADSYHFRYPGGVVLKLTPTAHTALIVAPPDATARVLGAAAMTVVEAALDAAGSVVVHAAGLTLPGADTTILIHAPSGTGKTTSALALAGAGFGLCSDDAMVLRDRADGFVAWGLPRDIKVHRNTVAKLAWLQPFFRDEWDAGGEQVVRRAAFRDTVRLENGEPRPVAALFRLDRVPDGETVVKPTAHVDVLASLVADNVRASLAGLLPLQRRRFAKLARLVGTVPVFDLTVGSDLAALAPAILSAVTPSPAD